MRPEENDSLRREALHDPLYHLREMDQTFEQMHAASGRDSIPPERLLEHDVIRELFSRVIEQARKKGLMSSEHFSVIASGVSMWTIPQLEPTMSTMLCVPRMFYILKSRSLLIASSAGCSKKIR